MPPRTPATRVDEVLAFADATMATTLGSGRALKAVARRLEVGEQLLALGAGVSGGRKCLVATTSARLLVATPSRFGVKLISALRSEVGRVDIGLRLAGSVLTIRSGQGTFLIRGMAHGEAEAMREALATEERGSRTA